MRIFDQLQPLFISAKEKLLGTPERPTALAKFPEAWSEARQQMIWVPEAIREPVKKVREFITPKSPEQAQQMGMIQTKGLGGEPLFIDVTMAMPLKKVSSKIVQKGIQEIKPIFQGVVEKHKVPKELHEEVSKELNSWAEFYTKKYDKDSKNIVNDLKMSLKMLEEEGNITKTGWKFLKEYTGPIETKAQQEAFYKREQLFENSSLGRAKEWLDTWVHSLEGRNMKSQMTNPSDEIIKLLDKSEYKPSNPITVYRATYKGDLANTRFSAWTRSKETAHNFLDETREGADVISKKVNPNEIFIEINKLPSKLRPILEEGGTEREVILKPITREIKPIFQGFQDLTTKVLNRLKGKSVTSKQEIMDFTNMPELKQAERDVIRNVLDSYQIPVQEVENQVTELIGRNIASGAYGQKMGDITPNQITPDMYNFFEKYKPTKPIRLYRGISPKEEGVISNPHFTSWTSNIDVAEYYSGGSEIGGRILAREVNPDQILVEINKLPLNIRKDLANNYSETNLESIMAENEFIVMSKKGKDIMAKNKIKSLVVISDQIPVQEFADKVKMELLLLKVKDGSQKIERMFKSVIK